MIKIAFADNEDLFAQLLEDFLKKQSDIQCLFTALSGKEMLDKIHQTTELPDIVLFDLKMNDMEGVDIAKYLKSNFPLVKCVVMSACYQKTLAGHLMKAGVSAFVPKDISLKHLLKVIESVHNKGFYLVEEQANVPPSQIKSQVLKPRFIEECAFTKRETEVLQLLCQQYTAQEIANKLLVSKRTVESHKENLLSKTGARNLAGLVIYAIQNQLVSAQDYAIH